MVVIRSASAADAAQIAAVQRESWIAAYRGIISAAIIDRVTAPDGGARVRQTFRTRPWQQMIAAIAAGQQDLAPAAPGTRAAPAAPGTRAAPAAPGTRAAPAAPGIVGYACFGPETDVLTAPWPHPLTAAGQEGGVAELYALYVRPAWWSTGTGRALLERVLAGTARAGYRSITLWVLRDNGRARGFYERAGFAPDGATHVLAGLGGIIEVRYRRALGRPDSAEPSLGLLDPGAAG